MSTERNPEPDPDADRVDITLSGDTAEWFESERKRLAQQRDGNPPGYAEMIRLLLSR